MDEAERYAAPLEAFLRELKDALSDLRREVPGLTVSMKQRPEEVLAMLPRVLAIEQMSFLELRYSLPGRTRKNPGIRFWLEGPLRAKRLRAVLFEDTVVWNVSHDLEKLYTELGTFSFEGDRVLGAPAAALPGKPASGSDWRVLVRAVLQAPLA
jgi:hypothetical protein